MRRRLMPLFLISGIALTGFVQSAAAGRPGVFRALGNRLRQGANAFGPRRATVALRAPSKPTRAPHRAGVLLEKDAQVGLAELAKVQALADRNGEWEDTQLLDGLAETLVLKDKALGGVKEGIELYAALVQLKPEVYLAAGRYDGSVYYGVLRVVYKAVDLQGSAKEPRRWYSRPARESDLVGLRADVVKQKVTEIRTALRDGGPGVAPMLIRVNAQRP